MNERLRHMNGSAGLDVLDARPDDYQWYASRLKALADPERLRIVTCLLSGAKNVSELASELDASIVKTSHHLSVLRHADLVETKKDGKFVIYSLHPRLAECGKELNSGKSLDFGCCRVDLLPSREHR